MAAGAEIVPTKAEPSRQSITNRRMFRQYRLNMQTQLRFHAYSCRRSLIRRHHSVTRFYLRKAGLAALLLAVFLMDNSHLA
jgi:hypothetical protein